MTKTNPSLTFPYLLHNPSGNLVTTFHVVTHLASFVGTPIPGNTSLGKASLHQKVLKSRHIHALKPSYRHSILMEINGQYWVPMCHNGPAHECFTNILLPVPIPFVVFAKGCRQFDHPTEHFMLSCTKHIISIRFKIN